MDKIGGPVERIDHPRVFSSFALAALFGQYSVIRIGFKQNLKSDFLGFSVRLTDIIIASLPSDLDAVQTIVVH